MMAVYNPEDSRSLDLQCPVCLDEYSDLIRRRMPKLLLCLHTFCLNCMWRLRQNNGCLECSMCRATHKKVNPDQLLDNYVLLEYIKSQRESQDLEMAQEYQKAYNLSEGTPIASNVRRQLDISLDNFDPLQPLFDDDEDITEWRPDDSVSFFTSPRRNDESREVIDLTLEDTLEDGPISSDHEEDNIPNFHGTHEALVENTINLSEYENDPMHHAVLGDHEFSINNLSDYEIDPSHQTLIEDHESSMEEGPDINNLSDYEIDPSHQTLIEDHESSMEEGPSEQFVEPLLDLLHQYKCADYMGIRYMEARLLGIMSHFGIENERQMVHPIIQLIQEDKLVPMGDDAFVNHLRDIVRLYLMDVEV